MYIVGYVHVRIELQQPLHHVGPPAHDCQVQRSVSFLRVAVIACITFHHCER